MQGVESRQYYTGLCFIQMSRHSMFVSMCVWWRERKYANREAMQQRAVCVCKIWGIVCIHLAEGL
jgi:hypothetical protein